MTRTPRLFAVTALVVTPIAYLVTLLISWSAGSGNAAVIAAVPALFAAAFFGGLSFLAVAVERDELREPVSAAASRPPAGARAA
jgi:sorbitol-specific phosphotransferase system component IIBC